jgi:HAD superfamily hydrolase (TIGR01509 family)
VNANASGARGAVRAVLFDLGGVILRTEDPALRAGWEQRLGLASGELERLVFDNPASREATVGRASADAPWQWVRSHLDLPPEEFERLRRDFFASDRIDPELMDFIRKLRPTLRTGMITNAWPNIRDLLENHWAIAGDFDPLIISAEVGLAKPDPEIFRLALRLLALDGPQVVFIDDAPDNVDGARRSGLRAIRFRSFAEMTRELEARLEVS